jgi:hypothetical protein
MNWNDLSIRVWLIVALVGHIWSFAYFIPRALRFERLGKLTPEDMRSGHIESLPTFPGGAFDSFVGRCAYGHQPAPLASKLNQLVGRSAGPDPSLRRLMTGPPSALLRPRRPSPGKQALEVSSHVPLRLSLEEFAIRVPPAPRNPRDCFQGEYRL